VNRFRSKSSAELTAEYEAAGMLGLYSAIATFVPGKGRFSSWAHLRIKREVTRAVHSNEFTNMNYGDFEARPKILEALEGRGGAAVADLDAVAADVGVTRASVDAVVAAPRLSSMDAVARGEDADGESTLAASTPAPEADQADEMFVASSVSALEKLVLPLLTARELLVLVRRFGLDGEDPASSAEVGRLLGVSREAARQLESRTMAKLNHPIVLRKLRRHR
jgi:RNA polymerase sigma factor (sigma-70 family)